MGSKKSYQESNKKGSGKCAIYTRKTTIFGNNNELNNNAYQRMRCEAIINVQGEFIISSKEYNDSECDIEDIDRPALAELFNDIKLELVDTLVVYSLSVLSTNFKIIEKIMKVCNEHNVRIILARQGIDNSTLDGRRFFLRVAELIQLESFAEEQLVEKSESTE